MFFILKTLKIRRKHEKDDGKHTMSMIENGIEKMKTEQLVLNAEIQARQKTRRKEKLGKALNFAVNMKI